MDKLQGKLDSSNSISSFFIELYKLYSYTSELRNQKTITQFFMQKLKEIATVQMGYPFRARLERNEQGNVCVIQMKDLTENNQLQTRDLVRILMPSVKDHHLVQVEDIVFRSRGQTTTSVVINQELDKTVIAAPLLRIRVKVDKVLPAYISWYINQPAAQAYLAGHARGTAVPMIGKQTVEEMEIMIPPLMQQQKILELAELAAQEQQLLRKLAHKRKQYWGGILMQLAGEGHY